MFISRKRKIYRYVLFAFFILDVVVIGVMLWNQIQNEIPDKIWTYVGREEILSNNKIVSYCKKKEKTVEALHIERSSEKTTVRLEGAGTYEVTAKLFGFLPVKDVCVQAMEPVQVAPSGEPVGIYVATKGLLVLSTTSVEAQNGLIYEPAANIVMTGDYIIKGNLIRQCKKERAKKLNCRFEGERKNLK